MQKEFTFWFYCFLDFRATVHRYNKNRDWDMIWMVRKVVENGGLVVFKMPLEIT